MTDWNQCTDPVQPVREREEGSLRSAPPKGKGKPKSPEHRAAIKKSLQEAWNAKSIEARLEHSVRTQAALVRKGFRRRVCINPHAGLESDFDDMEA